LLYNVLELHYSHSHQAVISGKAIIFDTYVEFKVVQLFLIANYAVRKK
jgi:hypothetical protein